MVVVARRVNPNSRATTRYAGDEHEAEDDPSDRPKARTRCLNILVPVRLLLLAAVLVSAMWLAFFSSVSSSSGGDIRTSTKNASTSTSTSSIGAPPIEGTREAAHAKYQNCTVSFVPPPPRPKPEWRKPLWVPSYPASGSSSPSKKGDMTKQLIDAITGLKQATKNYHMSVKGGKLRRCYGVSETAACTQGHPYVQVGPESQTDNFQPAVIFSIRNFATAFPAGHADKNIAYHGAEGQPPEEQWRKVRDQYLQGGLQTWKDMIRWWRAADYYRIALYLPFEWLLSPTKGPQLVQQLADVYQQAGFEVAPPEDIPCIWYQTAQKEWRRQEQLMQYYTPGYTKEQRDFILKEFDGLVEELESSSNDLDRALIDLIRNYKQDILAPTITPSVDSRGIIKLDRPAENRTDTSNGRG